MQLYVTTWLNLYLIIQYLLWNQSWTKKKSQVFVIQYLKLLFLLKIRLFHFIESSSAALIQNYSWKIN